MAVYHDYNCIAHGLFESKTGLCPHGCGKAMSTKVYINPPAYHGGRTASIDRTLQGLAKDHGLSDMNNQNGTGAAFRHDPNMDRAAKQAQEQMMRGQTYAGAMGKSVGDTLTSGGFQSDNALAQVNGMLTQPKPNVVGSWNGKT